MQGKQPTEGNMEPGSRAGGEKILWKLTLVSSGKHANVGVCSVRSDLSWEVPCALCVCNLSTPEAEEELKFYRGSWKSAWSMKKNK